MRRNSLQEKRQKADIVLCNRGGTVIPDGMLAFGSPAKVVRPLTDEEKKENQTNGISYMLMKNIQKD